jgi:hypothetical protein
MKGKTLFSICALLLVSLLVQTAALPQVMTVRAAAISQPALPDLIVQWSGVSDPKIGKYEIRIKNIGAAPAKASIVVSRVQHFSSPGTRPKVMIFRVQAPPIAAGQYADVVINTNLDLTLDSSCEYADYGNQVVESNETNNKNCGPVDS